MQVRASTFFLFLIVFIFLSGCGSGNAVPPEVKLAADQELDLWRAGAPQYLPEQYAAYKLSIEKAKENLLKVDAKFVWFRNYEPVQAEFSAVLASGEQLRLLLETQKSQRSEKLRAEIEDLQLKISGLRKTTRVINGGRVSRSSITKAEVALREAQDLVRKGELLTAEPKLNNARSLLSEAGKALRPVFGRYRDQNFLAKWRNLAENLIKESREKSIYAILVNKAERKLTVYKDGKYFKAYGVGIGRNGYLDKRYAGDGATPEGRYHVNRKNPRSQYHKALVINYPNEEDRREFRRAKKEGRIAQSAGIGGLIEIHGGGTEGLTYGCVSLDNNEMDELYSIIGVGTPVTIVGALDDENIISRAGAGL